MTHLLCVPMATPSPFAGLTYDSRADDLVRYREVPVDDALSHIVRSLVDALDPRREEVRQELSEHDRDTLTVFAQRRALHAWRERSVAPVLAALDAYAMMPQEHDVAWESWFKATLFVGRDVGLDLDEAEERFLRHATPASASRARVAFDAMARVERLDQCHVLAVDTTYGPGFLESTVVRDQGVASWGGITGQPVTLGQFQVPYAPTINLAQLTVALADALEASGLVRCSSIRQDQLVGSTFDLVTPGSYVDSLGCLQFVADAARDPSSFSVHVAEVASEEHDDVTFAATDLSRELAEAADEIEGQCAVAVGPCVVVLSELPSFDDDVDAGTANEERRGDQEVAQEGAPPLDLRHYLDIMAGALSGE